MRRELHQQPQPVLEQVRHGRVEVVPTKPTAQFTLVVVDESHHIYSVPKLRDTVESYVTGDTRRVLVSDVSQSLGWGVHRHAAAAPVEALQQLDLAEAAAVLPADAVVANTAAMELMDDEVVFRSASLRSVGDSSDSLTGSPAPVRVRRQKACAKLEAVGAKVEIK